MSSNLRVGVVGVGYLGRFHARIYSEMSGVDLVGVVDTDARTAKTIAHEYGCDAFADHKELFGKVDAVSIVVPTSVHKDVAIPFLERGVHMLLEKPVASNIRDAETIVSAAEAAGVVLQIGHLERFNAGIMELAARVENPMFIEAHRLGPFVARATDVDVVTDLMIHDIDIVLSLVNSEIHDIAAIGLPVLTKHVDIANARIEFKNGAVANVTASRVSNKKFRRIRIFGQESYHALNFVDQQIEVVRAGECAPDQQYPEIITENVEVDPRQPLDAELEHFVNTVHERGTPLVSGRDGLEALRVATLVKEKIEACLN